MKIQRIKERLERLTDAYLDNMIEKDVFEERRLTLLANQKEITFNEAQRSANPAATYDRFHEFLELASSLQQSYELAIGADKRDLVQTVTSNRQAHQKNLAIALQKPFQVLAEVGKPADGDQSRDVPRTVRLLIEDLARTMEPYQST